MADSKHEDYSSRHQSRAVVLSALIGSLGLIVAALIGVSFGRERGEDQRADLREELARRDAEVAELRREIADIRSAQAASTQDYNHSGQGDSAIRAEGSAKPQDAFPVGTADNQGVYDYQTKVAQLRVWGHGSRKGDQLQLTLESISNHLANGLVFSFLVENSEKNAYDLRLSNPESTTVVLDDQGDEHKLVNSEGIRDNIPLKIPAFSRHRFKLIFEPVHAGPQLISFQAVFVAKVYSTLGGEGQNPVKIDNIAMVRFK